MKKLLALVFIFATTAMAKPIATITTSGGFTMTPTSRTVTIDPTGLVNVETVTTSREEGSRSITTKVKVAKLNPSIVGALLADIAQANNLSLVADNPDGAECMDAPSVVFSALKDGVLVEIGKKVNCKSYYLSDFQARTAMSLLQNILEISYFAQ